MNGQFIAFLVLLILLAVIPLVIVTLPWVLLLPALWWAWRRR